MIGSSAFFVLWDASRKSYKSLQISSNMLRTVVHYSLHLLAPGLIALAFGKGRRRKAYLVMLATMAIDMGHLLATGNHEHFNQRG